MKTTLVLAPLLLPLCALAQLTAPTIVERGPHHRVWSWTTQQTGPDGRVRLQPHSYVELATGLCYQRDGQGPWLDAQEVIEVLPDGRGIARQGQHQVEFPVNLKDGLISLRTPEGKRFCSRPLGLAYYDAATGRSVLIAELQDAPGKLIAPNTVLYPDAFDDVAADVRLVYRLASFEADVILRRRPPGPERWGLDPRTTRLQVWTEFLEAPAGTRETVVLRAEPDAQRRRVMAEPDFTDQRLHFGAMHLAEGCAFALGDEATSGRPQAAATADFGLGPSDADAVPVAKEWTTARDEAGQERTFLIESAEWPALQSLLEKLPVEGAALPGASRNARTAAVDRRPVPSRAALLALLPKPPAAPAGGHGAADRAGAEASSALAQATGPRGLATLALTAASSPLAPQPGVVLDYSLDLKTGLTNFTFEGDVTYVVSGTCYLSNVVFEGGTVIKFAKTGSTARSIRVNGPVACHTSPWRPAVFTAWDDDSVGEILQGSSGQPSGYYAYLGLYLYTTATNRLTNVLHNLRFAYCTYGLLSSGSLIHLDVANVQFLRCRNALRPDGPWWTVRNLLVRESQVAFYHGATTTNHVEQATFHHVTNLVTAYSSPLRLTNSLLVGVTTNVLYTGTHVVELPANAAVFQTAEGGAYYLADNSPYRDAGTPNLSPAMLAALKELTTYPPIILTNPITLDTTLAPQAPRDTDTPDLGYHYAPLDYLVSGLAVTNATLLATNGVVVGVDYSRSEWGFILQSAQFLSQGTATQPNRLVRAHNVQEQSSGNPGTRAGFYDGASAAADNVLRLRHTECAQLADDGYLLYAGTQCRDLEWTHSAVYNPSLVLDTAGENLLRVGVTNTLWHRGGVMFGLYGSSTNATVHLRNNLFRGCSTHFVGGTTNWTVRDNLFDSLYLNDHGSPVANSHNGYHRATNALSGGTDDRFLSVADYEVGPLGRFYYPTNGASGGLTNLFDVGSRSASEAGLYHFTTTTNQVKETNSVVDIGLHCVALNPQPSTLNPMDTDGDGLPDYLEDANGNGTTESGETDWQLADTDGDGISDYLELLQGRNPLAPNLTNDFSGVLRLRVYTPLK